MKYKIEKNTVQETLIIPLYARKVCSEPVSYTHLDVYKRQMLLSAKQETSRLLGEDAENQQARQMIMRRRSTE